MRSFSGLYFGLRILAPFSFLTHRFLSQWTYKAILMSSATMLIALVQPYKKTYMNVLDSLILSLFAINCHLLSLTPKYPTIRAIEVFIISSIPGVIFWLFVAFQLVTKLWKRLRHLASSKIRRLNSGQEGQLLAHPCTTSIHIQSCTENYQVLSQTLDYGRSI